MAEIADVVVVGGGGGGLASALAAIEAEAEVTLIESGAEVGGTSRLSIGSITASGTRWQRARGIADSPDAHFADMDLFPLPAGMSDNLALRRILVDNVTPTLDWLAALGLVFHGPMPEPPHTRPRMHNVLPAGRAYIAVLARHCARRGVRIHLHCPAERLIVESGRVAGVVARTPLGEVEFRARRGVVLASGDISAAADLRAKYLPAETHPLDPINPGAEGGGHRMALALGARVVNGGHFVGPEIRFVQPKTKTFVERLPVTRALGHAMRMALAAAPRALLRPFVVAYMTAALAPSHKMFEAGAFLVNANGARFVDELNEPGYALAAQPEKIAYVILDSRVAERFARWPDFVSTAPGIAYAYFDDYRRYRPDLLHRGETIVELAQSIGASGAALTHAVAQAGSRPWLAEPPYYALGPAKAWLMTTDGGLAVNTRLEVLGPDDAPIPGLYAAGSAGQGGMLLPGHGQHLGWAFTSGRIAGRNAAMGERGWRP